MTLSGLKLLACESNACTCLLLSECPGNTTKQAQTQADLATPITTFKEKKAMIE